MEHWEFVGRADELARLTSAATTDSDRGLILSGAAGIGKSRLLHQAVSKLPTEQYAVHSASANIASSGLPFGGLAQILPPDVPDGLSPAGMLRWAVDGLNAAAGDRPIVLAIDDAHLLDPPSAALAHLLVREGATLLGALRIAEPVPTPISALWTEGLLSHAELAPLTDEEARELLTALVGGPVEAGSAQRLARLGGGNPLLLRELMLAATGGGELTQTYGFWRWSGRLTLAPSLADLVDARIGELTAGVRDVLELVSFGEPVELTLLLRGAEPRDVEAAEERGLIRVVADERRRDVRLAHPLYGEVVRRGCPVTRSRRLLAGLADLVEGTGAQRRDDLLRIAAWRLDAGTRQDAALLLAAARQAFDHFDIGLALRLAAAAHAAGGGYPAAELHATVLLFADCPEQALAVLDATPDDSARGITARAAVEFLGLGRPEAAAALAAAKPTEPADAARVHALEAFLRLQLDELEPARVLARGVLGEPAAGVATKSLARCVMAFLAAAGGDPDAGAEQIATVVADAAAWRRDNPVVQYALLLAEGTMASVSLDLHAIDGILAAEFAHLAQAGGFGFGSGWASLLRARAALLRGRTDEALRATEQACAALAPARVYDGSAHFARANAAALLGQVTLAVEALAIAESATGGGVALYYPWREQARAWTLVCRGEVAAAAQVLRGSAARARADGFHGHELLTLYDLVRIGRPDLAADRMTALAGTVSGGTAQLLIRHARACADEAAEDLFTVAREFAVLGYQLFAAEAAAGAVRIFRQARDPRALAASTLMADVLGRCGTMRTPALLAVQPALTVRERQVAELAAEGVRSREIADRLYLSPRTVENHLQRVYTKLGVNGRVELAPALRLFPR
ncbi:LuxR C-terminal-related transcriptional regulator [Actinoplanes sp. NPDC026623]|uniref:helix-turn-helix transcriptional regulator n=1 Tax=Actinoplanes sp. NPDC026623 TaxID=3155610 RepID=UPI0033C8D417